MSSLVHPVYDKERLQAEDSVLIKNLNQLLMTTHGTEQVLDSFYFETQSWLYTNGMTFSNEHLNMNYAVGVDATHKCTYTLYANHNYLGQLSFARRYKFESEEIEIVEHLISVLLAPLQQAIACHEACYL